MDRDVRRGQASRVANTFAEWWRRLTEEVPLQEVDAGEPLAYCVRDALATGRNQTCTLMRGGLDGDRLHGYEHSTSILFVAGHHAALDDVALEHARGRVLDLGAGAGRHALALQERGLEVTAVERSPTFCELMRERGVRHILPCDFGDVSGGPWDTILLLYNGLGMAGRLALLTAFLARCRELLARDGQVLAEFQPISDGTRGERTMRVVYKRWMGAPFPWFWPSAEAVEKAAREAGLSFEVLARRRRTHLVRLRPVNR